MKNIIPIVFGLLLSLSLVSAIDVESLGNTNKFNNNDYSTEMDLDASAMEVTDVIQILDNVEVKAFPHDDGNTDSGSNSGSSGGYGGGYSGSSEVLMSKEVNIWPCIKDLNVQIMLRLVLADYKGAILTYADPNYQTCAYVSWRSNRSALIDLISR